MKPQDFMEALGGVSQEKLDALAEWQEAKTPITGETLAREKCILQTAAEPVPAQRRSGIVKQKKKAPAVRLLPWTAGIGAVIAACAVIAVSIGKEAVRTSNQMQAGYSPETSVTEQISENAADEVQTFGTADQFYAWYWTKYRGDDIALDGKIVTVIRTAEDGKPYLTHSGQQNETTLATILSADWLENGGTDFTDPVSHAQISNEGEAHDVIFIGVPAKDMPKNMIHWDYHSGTVTPSGMLHLDFSVMTLSDEAMAVLNKQNAENTNFYYFISVPEGALPDLTGWEISFTEYHTDAMPDDDVIEKPDEIGMDGMSRITAWLCSLPEKQEWDDSVFGDKYIILEEDAPIPPEDCVEAENEEQFSETDS